MNHHRSERGFSLIELLMVLCISSILLRLAMPAFTTIRRNAQASQIQGDFNVIRAAAFAQYAATGSFPAEAPSGVMPAGLQPYLPHDFSFRKRAYELDWEQWSVADSTGLSSGRVEAITVVTPEPELGLTALHMLGANCSHWSAGDAHTFVIESTLESLH